jgi:hypothetical protein
MENQKPINTADDQREKRPNDSGQILVEAFVRITDPNTKQVLVETRA